MKTILILFSLLSLNLYAANNRFAGNYKIDFGNSFLLQQISFSVDGKGTVTVDENQELKVYDMSVESSYAPFDTNPEFGSTLTLKAYWTNDGSPEMMKIVIFGAKDSFYEPTLLSVITLFNDGDAFASNINEATMEYQK